MPKWEVVGENLIRDQATGIIYVKKYKAGRTLFRSTGTDKIPLAKSERDRLISEWLQGNPIPKANQPKALSGEMTMAELCDLFMAAMKDRHAQGPVKPNGEKNEYYRPDLTLKKDVSETNFIRKTFGEKRLSEITTPFWENWLETESPKLTRGVTECRRYLSFLFRFAVKKGYISGRPEFPLPPKADPDKSRDIFTKEEIARLFQSKNLIFKLQVSLMLGGVRPFEYMRLPWQRVTEEKGYTWIDIQNQSPKKPSRRIALAPDTAKLLREYKKVAPDSPWLFPQRDNPAKFASDTWRILLFREAIAELNSTAKKDKAPIIDPKKTAYWLRHSFYTYGTHELNQNITHLSTIGGTSEETIRRFYLSHQGGKMVTDTVDAIGKGFAGMVRARGKKTKKAKTA